MVNPILLIALGLGAAFTLGILRYAGTRTSLFFTWLTSGAMLFLSAQWLWGLFLGGQSPVPILTAGFSPPYAIVLQMGLPEAFLTTLVNLVGLLSLVHLSPLLLKKGTGVMAVALLLIMGLNGVILTRDLFNLFVFLEITALSTAGLIALDSDVRSLGAGFRYMIAAGIISSLFLLGTVFVYRFTGTLTMTAPTGLEGKGLAVAFFLMVAALVLELKPFPANGWALDVYERSHPAISALISGASATAGLYALDKILHLSGARSAKAVALIGLISFLGANLLALKQERSRRLLGYSSIAQIGLMVGVIGLRPVLGTATWPILAGLLVTHVLAKTGLFYLSGLIDKEETSAWARFKRCPMLLFMAGTFLFALAGFPPFPGFLAKWDLVLTLGKADMTLWIVLILTGSLLEAVYLFRWLGVIIKGEAEAERPPLSLHQILPAFSAALLLLAGGGYAFFHRGFHPGWGHGLLAVALGLFLLDFLPAALKNILSLAALAGWAWKMAPLLQDFRFLFAIIFIGGGMLTLLAGFARSGRRVGFYPLAMLMFAGLALLLEAQNLLDLLVAWELMTAGSYFLIIRGKKAQPHALGYMLFSLGGTYLIFLASALMHQALGTTALDQLGNLNGPVAVVVLALMATAFLTKTAALPLHIWLPGAHSEAESDVSPMVSAILLKAGVFGLVLVLLPLGRSTAATLDLPWLLGWVGAITAVLGNMMAIYQEDAKRLLAYSSVGQLGYVVFALAMMSHLGWLAAMSFSINHFLFKALLFLAIGGVVMRTHTREMYRMGGLIKRMPFSFISVLIGIIALSGVPPLSGFAGKWLTYNAVLEKGWFLQGALILFAGIVAFLYCFRLIHTVFLGQLKDDHRQLREAPFWMLVPQYLIILTLMGFSVLPNTVLGPVGRFLQRYFPDHALVWNGSHATSLFGYWDGKMVMLVVGVIFAVVLLWLLWINRRAQKVGQFNIVFAAEAPERPELTHYAYNFFAHYRRALGFLVRPHATRFWESLSEGAHSSAGLLRRLYTGNGQHYAIHMLAFTVVFYLLTRGG